MGLQALTRYTSDITS